MDNLSSKRIISDSKNADSNFKSNMNLSSSKVNNFDVDNNTSMSPSTTLNKLVSNNFKILHQNIRGIFHKIDELLISLEETSPHVLCITEHHLRMEELNNINLGYYILGSQYCRQSLKQGGVSIFVSRDIQFHNINLDHFNKEKDLEICALRISFPHENLIIICIYRSLIGNFKHFINQLEVILNNLYKVSIHLILCGDFNINHLEACNRTNQLRSLLASFNLFGTVTFPTRIATNSSTLIDNIYIDTNRYNFKVYPVINGLSNHDAQVMEVLNIFNPNPKNHYKLTRRIDSNSIQNLIDLLSHENWEEVFLD